MRLVGEEDGPVTSAQVFPNAQDVLAAMGEAFVLIESGGRILIFNHVAEEIFGYSSGEIVGQDLSVLLPESARAEHQKHLYSFALTSERRRLMGGRASIKGRRKCGEVFPAEASISKFTRAGRLYFIAIVRDISRRRDMERRLEASERRFRDVAEVSGDWIWETDRKGRFTFLSERFTEVTGIERERMLGRTQAEAFRLEAGTPVGRRFDEALSARAEIRDLVFSFSEGGARHIFRVSGKAVYDEDDRFLGYRGTACDITSSRRVEAHLLRIRAGLDNSTDAVALTDERLQGLYVNPAFRVLTGCGLEALSLRGGALSLFADRDLADRLQEDLFGGRSWSGEAEILDEAGGRVWVEVRASAVVEGDGSVSGLILVMTDIRARKEAERELLAAKQAAQAANEAKTRFLANTSHELRTPLNAIIGFSDLIAMESLGPMDNERYREYVGIINRSGKHLLGIINDILDISRAEIGGLQPLCEPTDLGEVLTDCCALYGRLKAESGITLELALPETLPPVWADRRLLRQIILNLLTNAFKFTERGGAIALSAQQESETEVLLSVIDSGIGMNEAQLEAALRPFNRLDNSMTRSREGVGLGLALVDAFVRAMEGRLDLESAPGQGTHIRIGLPLADARGLAPGNDAQVALESEAADEPMRAGANGA